MSTSSIGRNNRKVFSDEECKRVDMGRQIDGQAECRDEEERKTWMEERNNQKREGTRKLWFDEWC